MSDGWTVSAPFFSFLFCSAFSAEAPLSDLIPAPFAPLESPVSETDASFSLPFCFAETGMHFSGVELLTFWCGGLDFSATPGDFATVASAFVESVFFCFGRDCASCLRPEALVGDSRGSVFSLTGWLTFTEAAQFTTLLSASFLPTLGGVFLILDLPSLAPGPSVFVSSSSSSPNSRGGCQWNFSFVFGTFLTFFFSLFFLNLVLLDFDFFLLLSLCFTFFFRFFSFSLAEPEELLETEDFLADGCVPPTSEPDDAEDLALHTSDLEFAPLLVVFPSVSPTSGFCTTSPSSEVDLDCTLLLLLCSVSDSVSDFNLAFL